MAQLQRSPTARKGAPRLLGQLGRLFGAMKEVEDCRRGETSSPAPRAESSPSARARVRPRRRTPSRSSLSCTMPMSPPHPSARIRRLVCSGSPSEAAAVIHRQVSSMRPPMFQNQPSPPAIALATSASAHSTAHSIARRMSSSSSPTAPYQFPSAAPCRPSGTSTTFATYEACRPGRGRVTRSLELFAAVLGERLEHPEVDTARRSLPR